jgi:hypothetical protein
MLYPLNKIYSTVSYCQSFSFLLLLQLYRVNSKCMHYKKVVFFLHSVSINLHMLSFSFLFCSTTFYICMYIYTYISIHESSRNSLQRFSLFIHIYIFFSSGTTIKLSVDGRKTTVGSYIKIQFS